MRATGMRAFVLEGADHCDKGAQEGGLLGG
jgi:hypothetical protein